jgi:hypothetical protein
MMATYARRLYPRGHYEAPILYASVGSDSYYDSTIYNFSKGGIYFEPERPLAPESDLSIIMVNYAPGTFGPEAYKSYIARTRWCREVTATERHRFGVGAEFLAKSHEILVADLYKIRIHCDLCGKLCGSGEITQTVDFFHLCRHCLKHMNAMPDGIIKESIHRFLSGNVV